jgi:RNA polymerase sigma-70 factor (ECF subfamily)
MRLNAGCALQVRPPVPPRKWPDTGNEAAQTACEVAAFSSIRRVLSQNEGHRRSTHVDAQSDSVPVTLSETQPDLETVFATYYVPICRVLSRIVHDHARSEELAVDVFLRWADRGPFTGDRTLGWLYRTAVNMGLNELRRQARRHRFERLVANVTGTPATPEDVRQANEDQQRVRVILATLRARDAELLVLRSQGFRYDELATILRMNPASVGTLLGRAQRSFRAAYVRRYGHQ